MTRTLSLSAALVFVVLGGACTSSSATVPPDVAPAQNAAAPEGMLMQLYDVRDLAQGEECGRLGRELAAACGVLVSVGPADSDGVLIVRGDAAGHSAVAAHLDRVRRVHGAALLPAD